MTLTCWTLLAATAAAGTFFAIRHVILALLAWWRQAEARGLQQLLDNWRQTGRVVLPAGAHELGWLQRILGTGAIAPQAAWQRVDQHLRHVTWDEGWMATLPNIAQCLGLLGTVSGLVNSASGDPAKAIGLAAWTTVCGLLIAIPMIVIQRAGQRALDRHVEQVELVLAVLADLRDPVDPLPRLNGRRTGPWGPDSGLRLWPESAHTQGGRS